MALTVPSFLSVSGSPITSSGTFAISPAVTPTGTGALVLASSPTLITPTIGAASGTSLNLSSLTASRLVLTDASKNLVSLTTLPLSGQVLTAVVGSKTTTSNFNVDSSTLVTIAGSPSTYPINSFVLFEGYTPTSINGLRQVVDHGPGARLTINEVLAVPTVHGTIGIPGPPTWASPATSGIFIN